MPSASPIRDPASPPPSPSSARTHDGLGGQVLPELGADGAGGAVRTRDAAPHDAVAAALLQGLGLVDVGQALAEVEVGLLLGVHAIDP